MDKELKKDFPVNKIIPYGRNPRKNEHAVVKLAESIKRVGNNDPIEVDENYVILAGHTRKKALENLGIDKTDVVIISGLTEEQKTEYRITNNKIGELAEWDFEILEEDFSEEELQDFGFNIDFSDQEIKNINTEGYKKIHVLISFNLDYYIEIQEALQNLIDDENIEYEQTAN